MEDWGEQINRLKRIRKDLAIQRAELTGDTAKKPDGKYTAWKTEADTFFASVASLKDNLCYLHPRYLSVAGEDLQYMRQAVAAEPFDDATAAAVLRRAIATFKNAATGLLGNSNVETNGKSLCAAYATVRAVSVYASQAAAAQSERLRAEDDVKRSAARQALRALELQDEQYAQAFAACPAARAYDDAIEGEYRRDVRILLGCADATLNPEIADALAGFSVPLEWDLAATGVLHIATEDGASDAYAELLQSILLRATACYPAAAKRIAICDKPCDARLISFAGALGERAGELFFGSGVAALPDRSDAEIAATIEELNRTVSRRIALLGQTYADVLAYNAANPDNAQPLIFVLINGYPQGLSSADSSVGAFKNGRRAGVFFIVTEWGGATPDDYGLKRLPSARAIADKTLTFTVEDGVGVLRDGDAAFAADRSPVDSLDRILDRLHTALAADKKAIPLRSIWPQGDFAADPRRKLYSKTLSLPVGKCGAQTLYLELDSENDAHVMVSGTTGSGKSSLLNAVVLSAAALYTPREIELHLISITKSEFDIFAEQRLPHLKTLITRDNVVGANDVLDFLTYDMQKRQNAIGSYGDVVTFNAAVGEADRIPRSLIVIDEYQELLKDDKARDKMETLARLGRSCGMSLVLASQTVPVEFYGARTLFRHNFEFKGSSVGELIPEASGRRNELEGLAGLCFYGHGGTVRQARIAYAGKQDEMIGLLTAVRQKFGDAQMRLYNELTDLFVSDGRDIPYLSGKAQREYDEDGVCRVRLGRRYLTDRPVEYAFGYKNPILCICGEYPQTKQIEAAVVKDVLRLSRGLDVRTLYYIDLNRNPNRARKKTVVKEQRENWTLNFGGRFGYYAAGQLADALDRIEEHIRSIDEGGEETAVYPVIVLITCAEQIERDSDEEYRLVALLEKGKNYDVYFALQFNDFSRNYNEVCRKLDPVEDAIILPDPYYEGEPYTSAQVVKFLEQTEAAATNAKDLLRTLLRAPLDPKLCIAVDNSEVTVFTPYTYTPAFFDSLTKEETDA